MRRRLVIAATIAAFVMVAGVLALVWSLDSIVKNAIERYGSTAIQVPVRVDAVSLSLLGGVLEFDQLTVANPSGFSPGNVFALGQVQVVIERSSVWRNPVVVDAITIGAPQVYFELDRDGESNVEVIRRNLAQYRAVASGGQPAETPPSTPVAVTGRDQAAAEPRRFVIRTLAIHDAQVVIDASATGGERTVMALPDMQESEIGARNGGATGPQVAAVVVRALMRDVAVTVAAAQIRQRIEKGLGGETGKAVGEGVGEAVNGIGKALNRIFGQRGE